MNWATAVDRWADWMRTEGTRERTIELRRYQISHLGDEILRRNPWRIKTDHLITWMAAQDWAPETRRSYHSAINGFYTWGIRAGHTKRNPIADIKPPRMTRGVPRPTPDRVFIAALDRADDAERLMLLLAAYGGLRRAEIAALRFDAIDDEQIRVIGKGGHVRVIPLHARLLGELAGEINRRATGRRGTGHRYTAGIANGWIFPSRGGGPMTPNAVGKRLTKLLGPGWSGHTLRHRFLTNVLELTGDLAVTQELAGHASPATTKGYAKASARSLRAAIDAL